MTITPEELEQEAALYSNDWDDEAADTMHRAAETIATQALRISDLEERLSILARVEAVGLSDFHSAGLLEIRDEDLEAIMNAIANRRIMSAMDAAALYLEIHKQRTKTETLCTQIRELAEHYALYSDPQSRDITLKLMALLEEPNGS